MTHTPGLNTLSPHDLLYFWLRRRIDANFPPGSAPAEVRPYVEQADADHEAAEAELMRRMDGQR